MASGAWPRLRAGNRRRAANQPPCCMSIDSYQEQLPAVAYALLGMLAREPLSGYDIARQLRTALGFVWQAPHSQIYPELARLEAHGLVPHARVEQRERPE